MTPEDAERLLSDLFARFGVDVLGTTTNSCRWSPADFATDAHEWLAERVGRLAAPATDESSFLLAVATSPRDLTRRLAFADWLDDRGRGERAAFWRLPAFARWEADCTECRERKLWPYLPGVWERDKADVCLEAAAEGAEHRGLPLVGTLGCGGCARILGCAVMPDVLAACGVARDDGAVRVWARADAPGVLRAMSDRRRDGDHFALFPPSYGGGGAHWAESGSPFGVDGVSEHPLPGGWEVRIGTHA